MSHAQTLKKGYSHKNKQSRSPVHVCKHETSTTDKGAERGSTLFANQHRGCDRRVQGRQNDLQAKRMSLFIASFIRLQAMSVTSCQTRFNSQHVDVSVAINFVDPRRPSRRSQVTLEEADKTWAGGTTSPAWWTLKAAVGFSKRIIACESTSCTACLGGVLRGSLER